MVSFGHTAVGVLVGISTYQLIGHESLVSGLLITGGVGFISHYAMDFIPHGHFKMSKGYKNGIIPIIIFDLFLSIALFLGITYLMEGFSTKLLYLMFGIGGSQLPDVIDGLIYTNVIKAKGLFKVEKSIHEAMHWHGRSKSPLLLGKRDIWQLAVVLLALFLIIR